MKIIAFVGLPGSGKSLATDFLKKQKIKTFRLGDLTDEELKKRNLLINEQNEKIIREELRQNFGMDIYAQRVIEKIKASSLKPQASSLIIALDGVKSFEEYLLLKKEFGKNFFTIALLSNPETRHSRLEKRKIRPLTKEQCISRDYAELKNLNEGATIAMADYNILNENIPKTKLMQEINKFLNKIAKQKA